jgi:hypothetical protein
MWFRNTLFRGEPGGTPVGMVKANWLEPQNVRPIACGDAQSLSLLQQLTRHYPPHGDHVHPAWLKISVWLKTCCSSAGSMSANVWWNQFGPMFAGEIRNRRGVGAGAPKWTSGGRVAAHHDADVAARLEDGSKILQTAHRPAWVPWRISYSPLIHQIICHTNPLNSPAERVRRRFLSLRQCAQENPRNPGHFAT